MLIVYSQYKKPPSLKRDESYSRVATHVAIKPTFSAISGEARHDLSPDAPRRNAAIQVN